LHEGRLALIKGNSRLAVKKLVEAQRLAHDLEMPYDAATAHFELGSVEHLDSEARRAHFTQALATFTALDAVFDVERTERAAERLEA